MSVLRQFNFLGQQRVDVPHLRSLESSIAADFDVVIGKVSAGEKPMVIRGFTLSNFTPGTPAIAVQLNTADSILYNVNASESGTFLWVPVDRGVETLDSAQNPRVGGSFTAGQVNYIGLDLIRTADDSTTDIVQFLNADTLLEAPRSVPLGRTLDYRIVISTTPFSATPNLVPVAKIITDSVNLVAASTSAVQDARNILFRLGNGGDSPNRFSSFSWAQNRSESISGTNIFTGGDKAITSQKDWMNAVMSRVWELGGGENWYSPTADRNVRLIRLPPPAVFASTGDNLEFVGGNLHWQGLRIVFDNSNTAGVYYNNVVDQTGNISGLTDLVSGECIYVDLDRKSNATLVPFKTTLQALSVSSNPGARLIIAWNVNGSCYVRDSSLAVNTSFQVATTTAVGAVRLNQVSGTPSAPTVATLDINNAINIGVGSYQVTGTNTAIVGVGGVAGGIGILGSSSAPFDLNVAGVIGVGDPLGGIGVKGVGGLYGVYGVSTIGVGISGTTSYIGGTPAVEGINTGAGAGVTGLGGTNPTGHGVIGTSSNKDAVGVSGVGFSPQPAGLSQNGGGAGLFVAGAGSATNLAIPRRGGKAIEAIGGAGSPTTIGGPGGFGISSNGGLGGDGIGGAIGGQGGRGIDVIGGAGGGSTVALNVGAGGVGINSRGGDGGLCGLAIAGLGGPGGDFRGGDGNIAGDGILGQGGTATGGVGAAGVVGIGGNSGGAGGVFTGGSGNGSGVKINAASGFAVEINGNGAIGYNPGRVMKKLLGGGDFKYRVTPTSEAENITFDGPTVGRNNLIWSPGAVSASCKFYSQFTLPLYSVVNSVRCFLTSGGSGLGAITTSIALQKVARSSIAPGWTATPVFTSPSIVLTLSAVPSSQIFTPAINATVNNRTILSIEELYSVEFNFSAAAAANFVSVSWIEINYEMTDTLSW
jgi:hypothetical protein